MAIHVFYFNNEILASKLKEVLSIVYKVNIDKIDEFDYNNVKDSTLRYQITEYSQTQDFNYQLEIFVTDDLIINSGIYNNLILAIEANKLLNVNLLIDDESDNPYQWLLINSRGLYLVEEKINEDSNYGIDIQDDMGLKINLDKALGLLPKKNDVLNKYYEESYFIKNSRKWLEILE